MLFDGFAFSFYIIETYQIPLGKAYYTLVKCEIWSTTHPDAASCTHAPTGFIYIYIYVSNPIEVKGKTRENLIFPPPSGMRLPRITSWKSAVWPDKMSGNAWGLGSVATNLACTFLTDLEHVWDSTEWYSAWNKYSKCKLMVGRLVSPVPLLGFFSFGFKDGKRSADCLVLISGRIKASSGSCFCMKISQRASKFGPARSVYGCFQK